MAEVAQLALAPRRAHPRQAAEGGRMSGGAIIHGVSGYPWGVRVSMGCPPSDAMGYVGCHGVSPAPAIAWGTRYCMGYPTGRAEEGSMTDPRDERDDEPESTEEAERRELEAAGWEPRGKGAKTIW